MKASFRKKPGNKNRIQQNRAKGGEKAVPTPNPEEIPGLLCESEYPSKEEILAAMTDGAYKAVIDIAAQMFERVAANIRKGAKP